MCMYGGSNGGISPQTIVSVATPGTIKKLKHYMINVPSKMKFKIL